MIFTWDSRKATANLRKHGVDFREAVSVFLDVLSATGADPEHSDRESRWLTIGTSRSGRLLVVSHRDDGETVRVISARLATKKERHLYEQA